MKNAYKLLAAVAVCELAGVAGSAFTAPAIAGWYAGIAKPELAPPNWVFAPVWTALYALMGVAAFLVWKKGLGRPGVRAALALFGAQLALNVSWSAVFFGLRAPGGAFAVIALLWAAILATIVAFGRLSRPAAWLLAPYLLWVSFAGYLNLMIWRLN
jgi:tryptophan-rich sensory protein